jgi:hypothetical protein
MIKKLPGFCIIYSYFVLHRIHLVGTFTDLLFFYNDCWLSFWDKFLSLSSSVSLSSVRNTSRVCVPSSRPSRQWSWPLRLSNKMFSSVPYLPVLYIQRCFICISGLSPTVISLDIKQFHSTFSVLLYKIGGLNNIVYLGPSVTEARSTLTVPKELFFYSENSPWTFFSHVFLFCLFSSFSFTFLETTKMQGENINSTQCGPRSGKLISVFFFTLYFMFHPPNGNGWYPSPSF